MKMSFRIPPHCEAVPDEEPFVPARHLALEEPTRKWSLTDFGYPESFAEEAPFPLAVTDAFRMLTPEGVDALSQSVAALVKHRRSNERIANYVRGSLYHSNFVRDLCLSEDVNTFMSELAGRPLLPHPMALYQGHINLLPEEQGKDVDQWHTDTVALDYVLLLTDPEEFDGGYFEYFQRPRGSAIRALIREEGEDDIVKVDFPAAGYAVLQQGNLVVHRASRVTGGTERTTLVQSFIPDDPGFLDVSHLQDCKPVDPHDILYSEWARYKAFLSGRRLQQLMEDLPYKDDPTMICNELRRAIRDVEEAILEISDPTDARLIHFGQDALTDPTR